MKLLCLCGLLLTTKFVYANDDCPAAVDAAEAQNPNAYKNCDYSDKGLNGVLHRALSKSSAATGESRETKSTDDINKPVKEDLTSVSKDVIKEGEFTDALQLSNVRFALLQKASRECSKGFVVAGEKYLPVGKNMKLELVYHCL